MNYITSTLTAPLCVAFYSALPGGGQEIADHFIIDGGAHVASKHFVTKDGAVTPVDDVMLKRLEGNGIFRNQVKAGFLKVTKTKAAKTKDMEPEDKSAPLTPKSYTKRGKKAPKTTKA